MFAKTQSGFAELSAASVEVPGDGGGRSALSDPAGADASRLVEIQQVSVWSPRDRSLVGLSLASTDQTPTEADCQVIAEAQAKGYPIWVRLRLSRGWRDWYLSWDEFDRPTVSWEATRPVLNLLGAAPPGLAASGGSRPNGRRHRFLAWRHRPPLVTELLRLLPFSYELGARRAFAELTAWAKVKHARIFPAVGFLREPLSEGGQPLSAARLNVGSIDNLVFTLEQPHPNTELVPQSVTLDSDRDGPIGLLAPIRYLPTARAVGANDLVDGIALYLGATCEWIVEQVHADLSRLEERFFKELATGSSGDGGHVNGRLEEAFQQLNRLAATSRVVERELDMILQRVPAGNDNRRGVESTASVEPRYAEALDKVKAVQTQLRLAGETMASALTTRQLEVADQQRQAADDQRAETENLQRAGTLLASIVLVPGLVAAVYGANVAIPGGKTVIGMGAMLLFMLTGGFATWWLISMFLGTTQHGSHQGSGLWRRVKGTQGRLRPFVAAAAAGSFTLAVVISVDLLGEGENRGSSEARDWNISDVSEPYVMAAGLVAAAAFLLTRRSGSQQTPAHPAET